MCTGQLPFQGKDTVSTLVAVAMDEPPAPVTIHAELPRELSDLVMHLLAKKADDRPQTAQDVVEQLVEIESTLPKPAKDAVTKRIKPMPPSGSKAASTTALAYNPTTVTCGTTTTLTSTVTGSAGVATGTVAIRAKSNRTAIHLRTSIPKNANNVARCSGYSRPKRVTANRFNSLAPVMRRP